MDTIVKRTRYVRHACFRSFLSCAQRRGGPCRRPRGAIGRTRHDLCRLSSGPSARCLAWRRRRSTSPPKWPRFNGLCRRTSPTPRPRLTPCSRPLNARATTPRFSTPTTRSWKRSYPGGTSGGPCCWAPWPACPWCCPCCGATTTSGPPGYSSPSPPRCSSCWAHAFTKRVGQPSKPAAATWTSWWRWALRPPGACRCGCGGATATAPTRMPPTARQNCISNLPPW